MVAHELFGIFALAITGVVLVSALSPNAATGAVIGSSLDGFRGILDAISAPVRPA